MKLKSSILIALSMFLMASCSNLWEEHFDIYPETVDKNVWDAMQNDPEISEFVKILKDYKYETLFLSDDIPYTFFAPTNSALAQFKSGNTINQPLIDYHIISHLIQSGNIVGKRQIQTLSKKFALFEKSGGDFILDGIPVKRESPLYLNGKYFVIDQVAKPLPSLYDYFIVDIPILKEYIDSQDSAILDRELSKPIGFDEDGNTVFDSVVVEYNKFEAEFFPVSKEFRNQTATIVFPKKEDYEEALTIMSQNMNIPGYADYRDIPLEWQHSILIPHLLKHGVFENMLEPEEFVWKTAEDTLKMKNIQGDSIQITYIPVEKRICSNGYAYNYNNFQIPEKLYNLSAKSEGEWFLNQTGINRYAWNTNVKVQSDQFFAPVQQYVNTASNDTIASVLFTKGYNGKFSLELITGKMFPRKYVMIVQTHMNIGGIYDIYVNDELVRTFDYYDYVRYKQILPSVTGGRFLPTGSLNRFDMIVDNITEYSRVKIRFEYKAPGNVQNNGLVIDYVDFVPAAN